jgi:hypothetical protein
MYDQINVLPVLKFFGIKNKNIPLMAFFKNLINKIIIKEV